ncbi:MAG: ABC transporter permease [Selenomonadaceae bacterium]|nr:ABC transporter permease [Selenomonadaceae bacterium]
MFRSISVRNLFLTPFCVWAGIFIFVPLVCIIYYGLTDAAGNFTLANLEMITHREYYSSLKLSIFLAFVTTIVCLLLAYPLCLILVDKAKSAGTIIILLFVLPLWMNTLLSTMAWQTIFERDGILNQVLRIFSLPDMTLINTPTAVVIGMIYNYLPYMVLPLYVTLSKIDKSVFEAARDLGANSWQTFWKVTLPLSLPGAISGVTMVFIPALTTFAISALLGGSKLLLIGNVIEQEFTVEYDWHLGSALSIILMIFIIINMVLTIFFDNSRREEDN